MKFAKKWWPFPPNMFMSPLMFVFFWSCECIHSEDMEDPPISLAHLHLTIELQDRIPELTSDGHKWTEEFEVLLHRAYLNRCVYRERGRNIISVCLFKYMPLL